MPFRNQIIKMSGANSFFADAATTGLDASSLGEKPSANTSNGGNIFVTTNKLFMSDGSRIRSNAVGPGTSGNIYIKAQDIDITGFNPRARTQGSGLFTSSFISSTDSGNIYITTNSLKAVAMSFSSKVT